MENRAERWIWLGLAAVVAVVAVVGIGSLLRGVPQGQALPVLGSVPDFTLVERSGQALRRSDLDGEPWVADFIFTQCSGICPVLSTRMAELHRQARDRGLRARLVSFSVDPVRDTPEVLQDYAKRYGADDKDWSFVTGDREALHQLIGSGFKLSVAERSPDQAQDGGELITHSDRFVLVDAAGNIRGYYHGTDAESLPALLDDLATLQPARD